ncbi:PAAR domain-containing protein [Caballeronia sp. GAWG1-5s-s]|uniref:PAAR domain-containing protein n=1 Tax=Caballeronia sp. GAWG1-5s-s TaxID=2921743 RepID=UPI0020277A5C|nr:PAAR domain-containing protein [Caballeronia sp. GAWG1-5s-s]
MTKMIALKGNLTTTGGRVLDGDESMRDNGIPVARHMGLASCPRCKKNGPISGTATNWGFSGTRGVVDGDIVMCECPRGVNRVIARSSMFDS